MTTTTNAALTALATDFPIGAIVRNFGELAKVVRHFEHADGSASLILRRMWNDGTGNWQADPAKCERVDNHPTGAVCHASGLVAMEGGL